MQDTCSNLQWIRYFKDKHSGGIFQRIYSLTTQLLGRGSVGYTNISAWNESRAMASRFGVVRSEVHDEPSRIILFSQRWPAPLYCSHFIWSWRGSSTVSWCSAVWEVQLYSSLAAGGERLTTEIGQFACLLYWSWALIHAALHVHMQWMHVYTRWGSRRNTMFSVAKFASKGHSS